MPKKGNILLVANWESNVGYAWWLMENFWITITNHFESQGIISYLIYPKITHLPDSIASSLINVHEYDFQNHTLKNLRKLHEFIKSKNIKFIYLSDSPSYSIFYVLLRFWGIRKIIVHDHTPGERTSATGLRKLVKTVIQNIPLYTADHFVAVTSFVYNRFIEVSCIPRRKCSIAPNGIKPIDLSHADLKYAHLTFKIPTDRLIVVTTGRASYYKGIDFFIRCAKELIKNQNLNKLHFLFCGDGPDMEDFKMLVNQYHLDDFFTFTGKRSDVRKILPSCNIGFHTSKGEVGYSLSILEYMSAGLATIIPDNPSTSLATRHGITGLLYRDKDLMSACNAINQCISSELRNKLSEEAIKNVIDHYDINQTNKQLKLILDKAFV